MKENCSQQPIVITEDQTQKPITEAEVEKELQKFEGKKSSKERQ